MSIHEQLTYVAYSFTSSPNVTELLFVQTFRQPRYVLSPGVLTGQMGEREKNQQYFLCARN
jgi:hypothetical protein